MKLEMQSNADPFCAEYKTAGDSNSSCVENSAEDAEIILPCCQYWQNETKEVARMKSSDYINQSLS